MNFDKYIDNPSGGASVVTNRQMYKQMYKAKFDKVLIREQGRIKFTVFREKDTEDSYYIHILVPSEVVPKFYYDVVIRLFTRDNAKKSNANLREYAVQFYSNDPAFVYTFAHAFAKNKLFIDELKPKMSKTALSHKADVKNPKDEVWYVKSLYFAYLTMEKYSLFNRIMLDRNARDYNKRTSFASIMNADEKVRLRQEAQEKINKEKAKEKARERKDKELQSRTSTTTKQSKVPKTTKTTKRTKTTKSSKTISMKRPGLK